jgi:hypothetical protein
MRFTVYSLDEWGRTLHASVIECDSAEDAKRMGLGTDRAGLSGISRPGAKLRCFSDM